MRLLLKTSLVDIDPKDELGMTPLSYAAEGGHGNIVELLLTTGEVDADSKATAQIVRGRTPLSFAAEKGFTSIVQQLLQTGKVDPDSKTSGPHIPSRAPLSRGGLFLNLDTGSFEVNSKSTGNYVHVPDLTGVFMAALGSGRVASSKTVGRTPLSWAAEAGKEAVVQLLLDKKANANSVDMHGWTPLLWAASMGHVVVVELLLTAPGVKADQEASGCHEVVNSYELSSPSLFDKGRNSLSLAAEGGYSALVVSLLSKGLSVNSRDQRGRTPLSWAAMNGHKDVVWELLRAGAEAGLADKDGRTPLSYATEGGHETMAELLLGEGAELESRDT